MTTTAQRALEDIVNERMMDPEYTTTVATYLRKINSGEVDELLVNSIVQRDPRSGPISIYDAHVFMNIWIMIWQGQVVGFSIPIGVEPSRDHCIEDNNRKLKNLPQGFVASFDPDRGRGADNDGFMEWTKEIGAHSDYEDDDGRAQNRTVWIPPRRVVLEVGTTAAAKTMMHLGFQGAVCRWPYGSKNALVLINLEPIPFILRNPKTAETPPAPRSS